MVFVSFCFHIVTAIFVLSEENTLTVQFVVIPKEKKSFLGSESK